MNHLELTAGGPELTLAVLPSSQQIVLCQVLLAIFTRKKCITLLYCLYYLYIININDYCLLYLLLSLSKMESRLHADYMDSVLEVAMKGCEDIYSVLFLTHTKLYLLSSLMYQSHVALAVSTTFFGTKSCGC
jgi:hypothetical protein